MPHTPEADQRLSACGRSCARPRPGLPACAKSGACAGQTRGPKHQPRPRAPDAGRSPFGAPPAAKRLRLFAFTRIGPQAVARGRRHGAMRRHSLRYLWGSSPRRLILSCRAYNRSPQGRCEHELRENTHVDRHPCAPGSSEPERNCPADEPKPE